MRIDKTLQAYPLRRDAHPAGLLIALLTLALGLLPTEPALAGHFNPERYYQEQWCAKRGGRSEVVLDSGIRVDCMLSEEVCEFDFAQKYREGIVQALEYAAETDRNACLVLIIENIEDLRFVERADKVIKRYKLPVRLELMQ